MRRQPRSSLSIRKEDFDFRIPREINVLVVHLTTTEYKTTVPERAVFLLGNIGKYFFIYIFPTEIIVLFQFPDIHKNIKEIFVSYKKAHYTIFLPLLCLLLSFWN
jgi:hypothetical protein